MFAVFLLLGLPFLVLFAWVGGLIWRAPLSGDGLPLRGRWLKALLLVLLGGPLAWLAAAGGSAFFRGTAGCCS